MDAPGLLQISATVCINSAFAWLAGSVILLAWMRRAGHDWQAGDDIVLSGMRRAVLLCLAGLVISLLCATALMGDLGLAQAVEMLPRMLVSTRYGRMGLAALAALVLLGLLVYLAPRHLAAAGLLLLGLGWSRAGMGHAGEQGLLSIGTCVEWVHLVAMGLWVGVVAVPGWVMVPVARLRGLPVQSFLPAVSRVATLAVAGVLASGFYNAWQRLQTLPQLVEHPYGQVLTIKLCLFGIALGLGAWNRFYGFPHAQNQPARAIAVLRLESFVLLATLVAAAILTLQEPPY